MVNICERGGGIVASIIRTLCRERGGGGQPPNLPLPQLYTDAKGKVDDLFTVQELYKLLRESLGKIQYIDHTFLFV
jgi:hypothetical protein